MKPLHNHQVDSSKKQTENNNHWQEKLEPMYIFGGNVKWYTHGGNSLEVPQKNKELPLTEQFHFWYIHKRSENKTANRYLYTHIHSCIIHNSQKMFETTQKSRNRCINKIWHIYIHTLKYYYALKRSEILIQMVTQMNPRNIMLSEINQSQAQIPWFHLHERSNSQTGSLRVIRG